ncbi:MAG: hypothetical protein QGG42_12735 [Phycisphaerae bacterium]|jgi:hypothetical protein|nr:hypothetical protein [Phycisphaerae bacterium]
MKNSLIILAAAAAFVLTGTGVLADDIAPPWWRDGTPKYGADRRTIQQWEFGTANTIPIAEPGYVIPPASLAPQAGISPGGDWIDDDPDSARQGIWPLSDDEASGLIDLFIANYPDGPEKKIWVQLTWKPQTHIPVPPELGSPQISATTSSSIIPVNAVLHSEDPLDEDWIHSRYLIVVQPNPLFETIRISGDILVDEVVVDTICPEPASLLLLGVAVPFILRRKNRGGN